MDEDPGADREFEERVELTEESLRLSLLGALLGTVVLLLACWLLSPAHASPGGSFSVYGGVLLAGAGAVLALRRRRRRLVPESWRFLAVRTSRRAATRPASVDAALRGRLRALEDAASWKGLLVEFAAGVGFEGHFGWVSTAESFTKALEGLRAVHPDDWRSFVALERITGPALLRLERDPVVGDAFHDLLRLQAWAAARRGWSDERVREELGSPHFERRLESYRAAWRGPREARGPLTGAAAALLNWLGQFGHAGKVVFAAEAVLIALIANLDVFTREHPWALPASLLAGLVVLIVTPALSSPYLSLGERRQAGTVLALLSVWSLAALAQLAVAVWGGAAALSRR